jgi:hypothetical protein
LSWDVIGDVHGQFEKLTGLLTLMGYRETLGAWRHPDRTAIFVGDLIDRGPKQLATVDLVRRMADAGTAKCVLGNHEFNAIAWATRDPMNPGKFLRPHGKLGNLDQHRAFLAEVEGTRTHEEVIGWFKTLPLWLELEGLRVVHACWHQPSIELLQKKMLTTNALTDEMIFLGNQKGHRIYDAIEILCKGPEVTLPPGVFIKDSNGRMRNEVRVKWWQEDLSTYRKAAIVPAAEVRKIPDLPVPVDWLNDLQGLSEPFSQAGITPVLFGHYWFAGTPQVISPQLACLDYSVARGGDLVAYRFDGEQELASEKLVWV